MNSKLKLTIIAAAGLAIVGFAPVAFAEETTVTTTTTHRDDGLATIVTAPARAVGAAVGAIIGGAPTDCTKQTTTQTNEVTGTSVTQTRTDCD